MNLRRWLLSLVLIMLLVAAPAPAKTFTYLTTTVEEIAASLPEKPVSVGFDVDDTVLFSSPGFYYAFSNTDGPNGTNAWSWRSTDAIRDLTLAADLLVVSVGEPDMYGTTGTAPRAGALVALRPATGAEAWRLTLDGIAMRVEAASDRLVILVATPTSTTTGGTSGHMGSGGTGFQGMRRSLVAVDLTGRLLWTVALDQ